MRSLLNKGGGGRGESFWGVTHLASSFEVVILRGSFWVGGSGGISWGGGSGILGIGKGGEPSAIHSVNEFIYAGTEDESKRHEVGTLKRKLLEGRNMEKENDRNKGARLGLNQKKRRGQIGDGKDSRRIEPRFQRKNDFNSWRNGER